jgi:hypothetical protein
VASQEDRMDGEKDLVAAVRDMFDENFTTDELNEVSNK